MPRVPKTKEELRAMMEKNPKLFKKNDERTKQIASMGGKATQAKKRETRLFKEVIQERLAEKGESMEMIVDRLIELATENGGRDFEILRDTLGQKPTDKVEMKAEMSVEDLLSQEGNEPSL